jgi:hypothetical protein
MKHSEIRELLPWYANATLSKEEREIVGGHLPNCPECARELENLTRIQRAIVEAGNQVQASPRLTLDRALAQIEEYEQTKAQAAHRKPALDRLRERFIEFWSGWWSVTPTWPRAIIAVQAILLVCLGGTFYYEQHKEHVYTTSSASSGDRSSTRIAVGFDDQATEQQIRQVISAVHGTIVDGPSALGLYTIQVPIPAERSAEIQQALNTLRRDDRVVRFAEQKP